jgi:hypothetical protein
MGRKVVVGMEVEAMTTKHKLLLNKSAQVAQES